MQNKKSSLETKQKTASLFMDIDQEDFFENSPFTEVERYQLADICKDLRKRTYVEKRIVDLKELLKPHYNMGRTYPLLEVVYADTSNIYTKLKNNGEVKEFIDDLLPIGGFLSDRDVEKFVGFLPNVKPKYNVVSFKNGVLFDMEAMDTMEVPNKPILPAVSVPYNFNPNASGEEYIKPFLYSTFERDTLEETQEYITAVLETIGYLLTSGNSLNKLIFHCGSGGGGKSIFSEVISAMVDYRISNVDLMNTNVTRDTHASSEMVGKQLNIIREDSNNFLRNDKVFKIFSGNDSISVNPKNRDRYSLEAIEVPKTVIFCNNPPFIHQTSAPFLQRCLIVEYNHSFRNTKKQIADLDKKIIGSNDDMEWLVYQALMAYRNVKFENHNMFKLHLTEEQTRELLYKHSSTYDYLLEKYYAMSKCDLADYDKASYEYGDITHTGVVDTQYGHFTPNEQLVKEFTELGKLEGIEVPFTQAGRLKSKAISNALSHVFDVDPEELKAIGWKKDPSTGKNKKVRGYYVVKI